MDNPSASPEWLCTMYDPLTLEIPEPLVPIPCWGYALSEDWHIPSPCYNLARMHPLLLPKGLVSNWRIVVASESVERQRDPLPVVPADLSFSSLDCLSADVSDTLGLWSLSLSPESRATMTLQEMQELMRLFPQVVDVCMLQLWSCPTAATQLLRNVFIASSARSSCAWIVPVGSMSLPWSPHCTLSPNQLGRHLSESQSEPVSALLSAHSTKIGGFATGSLWVGPSTSSLVMFCGIGELLTKLSKPHSVSPGTGRTIRLILTPPNGVDIHPCESDIFPLGNYELETLLSLPCVQGTLTHGLDVGATSCWPQTFQEK